MSHNGYVDLKLISDDAIYRDGEGTEHVVEWVTQQDVDLARRITEIAAEHKVDADPASVSVIELGLDTARPATIAPVWAAPSARPGEMAGIRGALRAGRPAGCSERAAGRCRGADRSLSNAGGGLVDTATGPPPACGQGRVPDIPETRP